MKIVACAVTFVFMMKYSLADNSETYQVENAKEGSTNVLRVIDSSGKLVAVVDVHEEEDFQLIKPETKDDYVCLVLPALTKESKIYDCYDRVPFSRDEYNADALAECENRGIFILRPQYPEYCSNSFGVMRKKRSCSMRETTVTTCARKEKVCKKWGWLFRAGKCLNEVLECAEYRVDIITSWVCI